MAYIVVFGNEKGGSGKSTMAMHVMTALLRVGFRVGALDLDIRQKTLSRYIENRAAYIKRHEIDLPSPQLVPLNLPENTGVNVSEERTLEAFQTALYALDNDHDFIVIDCAGSHSHLAELAHAMADTLVTPLNDSFIDFDLLARIDPEQGQIKGPSIYSEMVWNARQARADSGAEPMDWIVTRNRVGAQNMHNKRKVGTALADLSRRIGFRIVPGFSDRVIFREMFPLGLTLLDMKEVGGGKMNISNIAARQEVRDLLSELRLPDVKVKF